MTLRRLTFAALALSLLGAGWLLAADVSPAKAADTYDINVILPLTGGASFLGKSEQQSLQLGEKWVNEHGGVGGGKQLRLIFHDDQTSPQTAVQLTNQALAGHPAVIFGSALVAMCNAMAPLVQNGPMMYCLSPGVHPGAGSYVFTCSVSTYDLAKTIMRYFRMKGWTNIAVLTSTDASGQDASKGINIALELPENKTAMKVVAWEHFTPSDVSVAAQIEKIKAAKPQAFIAWTTGAPVATVFKGVVQAGLDVPVATTDGNMTYAQMTQYASFLPKQLYIPAAHWATHGSGAKQDAGVQKAQEAWDAAYKAAGINPDVASAHPWDPLMIVVEGLRKFGPNATAQQLRDYVGHLKGYAGINGVYDFEREAQRGLTVTDAIVTTWDATKKTWVPVSEPAGAPMK